jgi:hypothetical protein
MTPFRFQAFFVGLIFCSAEVPDDQPPFAIESVNCVESCILEFAKHAGHPATKSDLDLAISNLGLDRGVPYRSLAQCKSLLEALGIPVRAVYLEVNQKTQYPPACILFIPPSRGTAAGHVVAVFSNNGTDLEVFDPSRTESTYRTESGRTTQEFDTVALVSSQTAFASDIRLHFKFWLPCLFVGGMLGWAFTRLLSKHQRIKKGTIIGLLGIGCFCPGCSSPTANELFVVDSSIHDFGVIKAASNRDAIPKSIEHRFRITNNGHKAVLVKDLSSSCACAVAEGRLQGTEIDPGKSIEIPVVLMLDGKVGYFEESIVLRFEPETIPSMALKLRGFILRDPRPSERQILLSSLPGHETFRETEIVYVRQADDAPSEIVDSVIEAGDGIANRFTITTPLLESHLMPYGKVDVWRFRVAYRDSQSTEVVKAKLKLTWKRPQAETFIELEGVHLQSVELLGQRKVLVPRMAVGVPYIEELPVRVNDSDGAKRIVTSTVNDDSHSVLVTSDLNVARRRWRICVTGLKSGPFRKTVRLSQDGIAVGEIELSGVVY